VKLAAIMDPRRGVRKQLRSRYLLRHDLNA
jgi:hypothetical protein